MFHVKSVSIETLSLYFYVLIGQMSLINKCLLHLIHSVIHRNVNRWGSRKIRRFSGGAGRENRTPTSSLARTCPTTKRYPRENNSNRNRRKIQMLFVRPEGLEPPISVPKTGVISISLRARMLIIIQCRHFSNVSE